MKKLPQLAHLIFSYYRENPRELGALQPLALCKLSRRWGTFIITCPTVEVYRALLCIQNILKEPITQLRLAKRVQIGINNDSDTKTFSIASVKGMTLEDEFKRAKLYR